MHCDVNMIIIGHKGRVEMLQQVLNAMMPSKNKPDPRRKSNERPRDPTTGLEILPPIPRNAPALTAEAFDRLFGGGKNKSPKGPGKIEQPVRPKRGSNAVRRQGS